MSNHKTLTQYGYLISKDKISNNDYNKLVQDLTKKALDHPDYDGENEEFKVYRENKKYISLPKYYGIKKYGEPERILKNKYKHNFNSVFKGNLREKQEEIKKVALNSLKNNRGGILSLHTGIGKCFAKGTKILTNKNIKKVENIKIGDKLIGDDGEIRIVTNITQNYETMYEIKNEKENVSYTVNGSHIISIIYKGKSKKIVNVFFEKNKIYDIELNILLYLIEKQLINIKDIKGYKRFPDLGEKKDYHNLYIKGRKYAKKLKEFETQLQSIYSKNTKKHKNKDNDIKLKNIFIDRKGRYCLLKGIIDEYNNNNSDKIKIKKSKNLILLINSLGCNYKKENEYIEVSLDEINYCDDIKEKEYDIEINRRNVDKYYGFTIEGNNRRFLLEDFTVAHNTVLAINIICELKVKTLVVVHKTFLQNQWFNRIQEFTGKNPGLIRQNKQDVKNKDIVVGMVHSISSRNYNCLDQFDMVVYDECHHFASPYFSKTLMKMNLKYTLGLSATPYRGDGLVKTLFDFMGDIIYKLERKNNINVDVKIFNYFTHDKLYVEKKRWIKGQIRPNVQKMITNMTNVKSRNEFTKRIIYSILNKNERKMLVLSNRIEHLKTLKKLIDIEIKNDEENKKIEKEELTTSFYIGGMKEYELEESEKADIIFASYSMAEEGLDIKELNTLLLATPKRNIIQSIGRILRKPIQECTINPMVIDICDNLSIFENWTESRRKYYNKKKYNIDFYQAYNDNVISVKKYLELNNIASNLNTDEDVREEFIKYKYGKMKFNVEKNTNFVDEPLTKYNYEPKFDSILT